MKHSDFQSLRMIPPQNRSIGTCICGQTCRLVARDKDSGIQLGICCIDDWNNAEKQLIETEINHANSAK